MTTLADILEKKTGENKLKIHLPREMREQIEALEIATSIVRNACLIKIPPVENNLFVARAEITSVMAGLSQILCKIELLIGGAE